MTPNWLLAHGSKSSVFSCDSVPMNSSMDLIGWILDHLFEQLRRWDIVEKFKPQRSAGEADSTTEAEKECDQSVAKHA
jgi:hypothetical protein